MIHIEYSSPSVKGREIFGTGDSYLVPYDEIWRTGANEATVFSTQESIKIDTFELPKGKYALFTIPGENSWEVVLNSEWNQWGTHNRQESLDVLRLSVEPLQLDSLQEQMEFSLSQDALYFGWENIGWSIPIN